MIRKILNFLIGIVESLTKTKITISRQSAGVYEPGFFQDIYVKKADLTMHLELHQSLDQMYNLGIIDSESLEFIQKYLGPGKVFLDIGANQGLYSCWVLKHAPGTKVISFEPDPYSNMKYEKNIKLNHLERTDYVLRKHALSDTDETKNLMLNTAGNRAGSSLVVDQRSWQPENQTIEVPCLTLMHSLNDVGVNRIDAVKLDIEGFEYPVLKKFFDDAPKSMYPTAIVVEAIGNCIDMVGGSPIELLINQGYKLHNHVDYNFFFVLKDNNR